MRAISNIQVTIDRLKRPVDVAVLTKLAAAAQWRVDLAPPTDPGGYTAVVERASDVSLEAELYWLVLLQALTYGRSPESVLSQIQSNLERSGVNMDEVFDDVPESDTAS